LDAGVLRSIMQESINLVPVEGTSFDVASIRATFLRHPDVIEDIRDAEQLQVVHGRDAQDYARERRSESERASLSGGVILVRSELVHFATTNASREELPTLRDLAQWMLDNHDCRAFGLTDGEDWTSRCAGSIDPMFEPELPPRVGEG